MCPSFHPWDRGATTSTFAATMEDFSREDPPSHKRDPLPVPYFKGFLWEWCVTSMGMGLTIELAPGICRHESWIGITSGCKYAPPRKGIHMHALKNLHTHQKKCELGDNPFLLGPRPRVELLVFGYQCGLWNGHGDKGNLQVCWWKRL